MCLRLYFSSLVHIVMLFVYSSFIFFSTNYLISLVQQTISLTYFLQQLYSELYMSFILADFLSAFFILIFVTFYLRLTCFRVKLIFALDVFFNDISTRTCFNKLFSCIILCGNYYITYYTSATEYFLISYDFVYPRWIPCSMC